MKDRIKLRLFNRDPKLSGQREPIVLKEQQQTESADKASDAPVMFGYATLYDVKTDLYWYTLSIDSIAFKESVDRGDDIVSLLNHDWNYLLGRTPNTLGLDYNKKYGLYQETTLPRHDLGKRVEEDIARGALTQMSVSFFIDEYIYTEGDEEQLGNFHVTKATLEDVSAVTYGQYPETTLGVDQKLYSNSVDKRQFEQLLAQGNDDSKVRFELQSTLELQLKLQEQRKRRLRGIHQN